MSKEGKNNSADIVPIGSLTLAKRSSSLVLRGLETLALHKNLKPIRVLVVDDISETRAAIRQLLSHASDIEVIGEARTGEEAIELHEELSPDVVSMNICMPDMDGITATNIICRKYKDARIIMLSVQSGADYMRRAMEAGAKDFITKPPSERELVDTIRSLADQLYPESKYKSEAKLQDYQDSMNKLMQSGLHSSKPSDSIRGEALSLSLAALRWLDGPGKGELLKFLGESGLINKGDTIIELKEVDLTWISVLNGAILKTTDLCNTNLQNAFFESTDLSNANLQGANLQKAILYKTNLSGANLSNASLTSARLHGSVLRKATLFRSVLSSANLRSADLREAVLREAILSSCDLRGANLSGTDLRGAVLENAWISYTKIIDADLRRANLRWANLCKANLSGADLTDAILEEAYLDEAYLKGAHISGEQLASAKSLQGAVMPGGTKHH